MKAYYKTILGFFEKYVQSKAFCFEWRTLRDFISRNKDVL